MNELLYKEEVLQLIGFCMEIHRELGKGYDEIIYKDTFAVELSRAGIPFSREQSYEIRHNGGHPAAFLLRRLRRMEQDSL